MIYTRVLKRGPSAAPTRLEANLCCGVAQCSPCYTAPSTYSYSHRVRPRAGGRPEHVLTVRGSARADAAEDAPAGHTVSAGDAVLGTIGA